MTSTPQQVFSCWQSVCPKVAIALLASCAIASVCLPSSATVPLHRSTMSSTILNSLATTPCHKLLGDKCNNQTIYQSFAMTHSICSYLRTSKHNGQSQCVSAFQAMSLHALVRRPKKSKQAKTKQSNEQSNLLALLHLMPLPADRSQMRHNQLRTNINATTTTTKQSNNHSIHRPSNGSIAMPHSSN